jgi:hypothetical protein
MARPKKRWADLSPLQRRAIVVVGLVQNGLLAATLIDLRRRPSQQINGDKRLWAGAAFVSFLGPISYFVFGRKR